MRRRTRGIAKDPSYGRATVVFTSLFTLLLVALLSVSCGRQRNSDTREYQIELLPPEPGVPYLVVQVSYAGQPVTDALVGVEGNMNHAGMVPAISRPVSDTESLSSDASADGVYHVPFQFTMLGDWIVTVTAVVDVESGDKIARDFDVIVGADSISLEER